MPTKPQHAGIYRPVPVLLRLLREEAGLTQRELAREIGRPLTWVHESETGSRRVDVAEFVLICGGCGVDARRALGRLMRR
jgi:transcriptional regulator with XRE-family HTH domain